MNEKSLLVGQLAVVYEALSLAYNDALEKTDLTQPDLPANRVPGELLEALNVLQTAVDTARRQAAAELLDTEPELFAEGWKSLGLSEQLLGTVKTFLQVVHESPLRYGQAE